MNKFIFLLIGLGIAFFFRDKFATFSRVTFPGEWGLGPRKEWWSHSITGKRVRVIWMNGEMLPPPPVPDPSMCNFAPQGVLR